MKDDSNNAKRRTGYGYVCKDEQHYNINLSNIRHGQIYMADLGEYNKAGLIGGLRPVIITSNDMGNKHSPILTVVPLSKVIKKVDQPTHYVLKKGAGGLRYASMAVAELIQPISKEQIKFYIGKLNDEDFRAVKCCIRIQNGLDSNNYSYKP